MSKYIDAEAFYEALCKETADYRELEQRSGEDYSWLWRKAFYQVFKNFPAADVAEVVRCKDCKYAHMTMDGECKYCDIWFPDEKEYMNGDYYCASGEKRGDT